MIKSDASKNFGNFKNQLILPNVGSLGPVPHQGSVVYNVSNQSIAYSTGLAWLPIFGGSAFPSNVITVSATSAKADYATIKEALAAAVSLLPELSSVLVFPGTYVEANPLVVPNGISLTSLSGPLSVAVIAQNNASDLFSLGNGCIIDGFTMVGGNMAVNYDGSTGSKAGSILRSCVIIDATIGVCSCVGPGELFCTQTLVRVSTGTTTIGFECVAGGKMRCWTSGVFGLLGNTVATGIRSIGAGSFCGFFSGGFQLCDTTVFVNDAASLELKATFIRDTDIGLQVGSTGTTSALSVDSTTIINTATYSLDIQATDATVDITGGTARVDMINNPNNVRLFIFTLSNEPLMDAFDILGDLHVGAYLQGTESTLGRGDAYTNGMIVLTDDGSGTSFMNVTNQAKDPAITIQFLQGFTVGNVIYIGSIGAPFFGWNITVQSIWGAGDSDRTVTEFWNGVSWVSVPKMVTKASSPYGSRTDIMLENLEVQRIRIGATPGWVANVVNSLTAFWIRIRATMMLSGPMATYSLLEIQPCSTKFNADGYIEYFGGARPIKTLDWNTGLLFAGSSSPGNQDVFLSDNLDVGKEQNSFSNGAIDRIGFNSYLPSGIDTSFGIKFRWSWVSTATGGNIDWVIRTGWSNDGFDIYLSAGAAPPVGVNEASISISYPVTETIGTQVTQTQTIVMPKINARPVTGNPDILWLTLERNGPADTHSGTVSLVQVQGEYVAWSEGGSLSTF